MQRPDHRSGLLACLAAQPVRECQPADIPLTESDFAFTLASAEIKQRIVVAVVAMSKKATSKPMRQILQLLAQYKVFDIIVFSDNVIMNAPVEQWPPCDALIAFHSGKFPLDKAIAYAKLHKPVMINDLEKQVAILSRVDTYRLLVSAGVPVSKHFIVDHLDPEQEAKFIEHEDYIEFSGHRMKKPFVEKPVCAM